MGKPPRVAPTTGHHAGSQKMPTGSPALPSAQFHANHKNPLSLSSTCTDGHPTSLIYSPQRGLPFPRHHTLGWCLLHTPSLPVRAASPLHRWRGGHGHLQGAPHPPLTPQPPLGPHRGRGLYLSPPHSPSSPLSPVSPLSPPGPGPDLRGGRGGAAPCAAARWSPWRPLTGPGRRRQGRGWGRRWGQGQRQGQERLQGTGERRRGHAGTAPSRKHRPRPAGGRGGGCGCWGGGRRAAPVPGWHPPLLGVQVAGGGN